MSSATPTIAEQAQKLSFAKVAASAIKPAIPRSLGVPQQARPAFANGSASKVSGDAPKTSDEGAKVSGEALKVSDIVPQVNGQAHQTNGGAFRNAIAGHDPYQTYPSGPSRDARKGPRHMPADQDRDEVYFGKTSDEVPVEERGSPEVVTQDCNNLKHSAPPEGAGNTAALSSESSEGQKLKPNSTVKISVMDDSSTALSSSDGSGKPPSIDGKSVASGTTFALDEKESLRPDDSASLRAVEEEDIVTPSDNMDSRQGSENGLNRAFREQLNEITEMIPQAGRGAPPGRFPNHIAGAQALYDPNQSLNTARRVSQPLGNGGPSNAPFLPDAKLLEALMSPRDRLFITKLEHDFGDLINSETETELLLPSLNTFYRMLAHRLADYFLLGHVVNARGDAIRIIRTPFCKIPPPISQMIVGATGTSTPPAEVPVFKIMRRADGQSGTPQNASKSTSEVGSNEGSDSKKNLTREEKEAHYHQTRARIFGTADGAENAAADETVGGDKGKGVASGKKKANKQRNNQDDDFQARSRFNLYYPQQFGYPSDPPVFYPSVGTGAPFAESSYASMGSGGSPQQMYTTAYPVAIPSTGMPSTANGQYGRSAAGSSSAHPFCGALQNGHDLSADFQRGMNSFQNAAGPSQLTPTMGNVAMAPYPIVVPQTQPMINPGWPQGAHQPMVQPGQGYYGPSGPGGRPQSAHHQGAMPSFNPYGQGPSNAYNGMPNNGPHPVPGSYNRPQFNPQSQAFIPGGRTSLLIHQHNGTSGHILTGSSPANMGHAYQSSGHVHGVVNNHSAAGPFPAGRQLPASGPSFPGNPSSFGSPSGAGPTSAYFTAGSQFGEYSTVSSISKYGTPASLPARPPAPAEG